MISLTVYEQTNDNHRCTNNTAHSTSPMTATTRHSRGSSANESTSSSMDDISKEQTLTTVTTAESNGNDAFKLLASVAASASATTDDFVSKLKQAQSNSRQKRKRTSAEQFEKLLAVYNNVTTTPSFSIREELAKTLGMTNREIQVWFQNRRAKLRNTKNDAKPNSDLLSAETESGAMKSTDELSNTSASASAASARPRRRSSTKAATTVRKTSDVSNEVSSPTRQSSSAKSPVSKPPAIVIPPATTTQGGLGHQNLIAGSFPAMTPMFLTNVNGRTVLVPASQQPMVMMYHPQAVSVPKVAIPPLHSAAPRTPRPIAPSPITPRITGSSSAHESTNVSPTKEAVATTVTTALLPTPESPATDSSSPSSQPATTAAAAAAATNTTNTTTSNANTTDTTQPRHRLVPIQPAPALKPTSTTTYVPSGGKPIAIRPMPLTIPFPFLPTANVKHPHPQQPVPPYATMVSPTGSIPYAIFPTPNLASFPVKQMGSVKVVKPVSPEDAAQRREVFVKPAPKVKVTPPAQT